MFTLCFSFRYQYYQESDGGDGHPDQSCVCDQHHASHNERPYQGQDACRCHQSIKSCRGIKDPDYKPSYCSIPEGEEIEDGMTASEDVHECCGDVTSEKKYIVFHNQLMELFQCCPICAGPSRGQVVNGTTGGYGTMVKVEQPARAAPTPGHGAVTHPPATCHLATWCCQQHGCSLAARLARFFASSASWTTNASGQRTNAIRMTTSSPLSSTAGRRSKQPSWLNWGTSKAACSLRETAEMTARDTRPGTSVCHVFTCQVDYKEGHRPAADPGN